MIRLHLCAGHGKDNQFFFYISSVLFSKRYYTIHFMYVPCVDFTTHWINEGKKIYIAHTWKTQSFLRHVLDVAYNFYCLRVRFISISANHTCVNVTDIFISWTPCCSLSDIWIAYDIHWICGEMSIWFYSWGYLWSPTSYVREIKIKFQFKCRIFM